jgi:hypothetical protein
MTVSKWYVKKLRAEFPRISISGSSVSENTLLLGDSVNRKEG